MCDVFFVYNVNPAEAPNIIAAKPYCKGVMPLLSMTGCGVVSVEGDASSAADVDEEDAMVMLYF